MRRILLVDDEVQIRRVLSKGLVDENREIVEAESGQAAAELVTREFFDVAILDIMMPDIDGIDLLGRIKRDSPETEVIMLTADATLERGLQAMRLGAYDYVTKPFHLRSLKELCVKAFEKADLRRDNSRLERELSFRTPEARIVGGSRAIRDVLDVVAQVAPTSSSVLITGESGTGKELVARAIHDQSPRSRRAFIAVNCGAFQENLLESELFGYRKGAFTGATQDKPGLFDVADGGTLFLDEIGELPAAMQVKLLRVLDTRRFRPIGDTREREVDFRLLAATNRDLVQMLQEGKFREDLYFRLNVVALELPPLRRRKEDIPELVEYLLERQKGRTGARRPSPRLIEAFRDYDWPGNVRELVNQLERSAILSQGNELEPIGLRTGPGPMMPAAFARPPAGESEPAPSAVEESIPEVPLEELEKRAILAAMERHAGNVSRSAASLGIDRRTLHRKLKSMGLASKEIRGFDDGGED